MTDAISDGQTRQAIEDDLSCLLIDRGARERFQQSRALLGQLRRAQLMQLNMQLGERASDGYGILLAGEQRFEHRAPVDAFEDHAAVAIDLHHIQRLGGRGAGRACCTGARGFSRRRRCRGTAPEALEHVPFVPCEDIRATTGGDPGPELRGRQHTLAQ